MTFNLDNYVEVKDRIPLFYEQFPDGRITTEIITEDSTGVTIKAYLWKNAEEQVMNAPLATGLAREFPGGRIDKYTENGETSAIGRAIANFNLIGEKGKKNRTFPSREEMESAQALIDKKEGEPRYTEESAQTSGAKRTPPKQAQKPPKTEEPVDDNVWEPIEKPIEEPVPVEEDVADILWCPLHDTEWFLKGKMPGFAHPMADHGGVDGEWCNQPKDGLTEARFMKQCEHLRWSLAYVEDTLLMTSIADWQELAKISPGNYGPVLKECLRIAAEEKGE